MSTISRYELGDMLPDNSQQAFDRHLNRDVVVKAWWSESDRDDLKQRIDALTRIQNRHLADIYDLIGLPNHKLAIVEESLDGATLSQWNARMPTDETEILRVLLQMTGAVAGLHAARLSPASLDSERWQFDGEGILNLSPFCWRSGVAQGPVESTKESAVRQRADLRVLAQFAQQIAERFVKLHAADDPALKGFWSGTPSPGDTAKKYHRRIHAHCIRDRHRAVVVNRGQSSEINSSRRTLRLTHPIPNVAEAVIHYDGLEFHVQESNGEVYINNEPITPPEPIAGACVITLGAPSRPWSERYFITLDIAHPEVVF